MIVDNIILDISATVNGWNVTRKPGASVTVTDSGAAYGVRKWSYSMRGYEIPFKYMVASQYAALMAFFDLQGLDRGFLLWAVDGFYLLDESIGSGDGSTTTFQLGQTVSNGVTSFTRTIYHPVPTGTAVPPQYQGVGNPSSGNAFNTIKVNGVTKTEGTDYTIDASTGVVTFATAPGSGLAVTWSGWYYTPVRFTKDFEMNFNSIYGESTVDLMEIFYS
ncbi:MAG TPA: DUF2460 domain-containing protein [Fimbriimonadaceae bacterium]|jgi:uncharacterized protein (TIGR02217 family)